MKNGFCIKILLFFFDCDVFLSGFWDLLVLVLGLKNGFLIVIGFGGVSMFILMGWILGGIVNGFIL